LLRKVYRISKAGSIENLQLIEENVTEPEENELRIETKAIGLNFADIFALTGLYSATPKGSFVPGLEFSGIVSKKGSQVKNFSVGDRVMGVTRFGAYATQINIQEKYIRSLPKSWSFSEGAGFLAQGLTAYYALIPLGNLKKNQTVLIHSAAGGVGILANRIAKKIGAYTIGVVGDEKKFLTLEKEKYDSFFVRDKYFKMKLEESLKDRELNLVLECIGGKILQDSFDSLSPTGRLVTYGSANFTPKGNSPNFFQLAYNYLIRPKIDPLSMISWNKSLLAFNLIWLWDRIDEMNSYFDELMNLSLSPQIVGRTFPFEHAIEALQYFKTGKSVGKVVLEIS
jgi:NADPH:quinone reductase-like Zn-dependent oxidoreductase